MARTYRFEDRVLGIKVLVKKNVEYDEYQARVYINDKFDEDKTYFGIGGSEDDYYDAKETGRLIFEDLRKKADAELKDVICDLDKLLPSKEKEVYCVDDVCSECGTINHKDCLDSNMVCDTCHLMKEIKEEATVKYSNVWKSHVNELNRLLWNLNGDEADKLTKLQSDLNTLIDVAAKRQAEHEAKKA